MPGPTEEEWNNFKEILDFDRTLSVIGGEFMRQANFMNGLWNRFSDQFAQLPELARDKSDAQKDYHMEMQVHHRLLILSELESGLHEAIDLFQSLSYEGVLSDEREKVQEIESIVLDWESRGFFDN